MDRYNALHIRQSPNLRQAIRDALTEKNALFGLCIGLPSVDVAKVIAATQSDWVFLDAEHTPFSPTLLNEMVTTLRYYSQGHVIPIVRVPTHSHEWIAWAADAGAGGVVIPHTETAEQVQSFINAGRFPTQGKRSFPPLALLPIEGQTAAPDGKTWFRVASDNFAIIPQIESLKGVENAEEMMKIDGVDAIMIGRFDLSFDMGGDEEAVDAAIKKVEVLAKKYNKPLVSFIMDTKEVSGRLDSGYHLLMCAADALLLAMGTNKIMTEGKETVKRYNEAQASRHGKSL